MVKLEILTKHFVKQFNLGRRGSQYIQIGITITFVILVNRSLSTGEIGLLLGSIDPITVLIALFLGGAAVFVQAFRWHCISRTCSLHFSYSVALQRLLWGNLLAFITPGSIGELFRGVDLCPSRKLMMILSTLADRIFGNVIVVFTAVPVLIIQLVFLHRSIPLFLSVAITVTVVLILLFFALMKFRIRWYDKLPVQIIKKVSDFITVLNSLDLSVITGLSLVHHLLLVFQAAILLTNFVHVSLVENFMISVLAYTCMLFIPVSIANIGVREYSFSLFLSIAVIKGNSAFAIPVVSFCESGLLLVMNMIIPAIAGLLWRIVSLMGGAGTKTDSVNDVMILQSNELSKEKGLTDATG
jgi:uncharacterized membrane protein YbhN (UPF0104 family)